MAKFRKKPVVIEAVQWTGGLTEEMARFLPAHGISIGTNALFIHTSEGTMCVSINDWIIKGVKGEFYPCKPTIFALTYEAEDG